METNLYHLTAEQRRERGIVSLPETLGEAIDELVAVRAGAEGARPAHLRPLRRDQAQGVGRVPRPAHRMGDGALPARALTWVLAAGSLGGGTAGSPHEPPP